MAGDRIIEWLIPWFNFMQFDSEGVSAFGNRMILTNEDLRGITLNIQHYSVKPLILNI